MKALQKVIGYRDFFDHYALKPVNLGKGKYGIVKKAIHCATKKKVAVKMLSKEEMTPD